MQIKYNIPVKVSQRQYNFLMNEYAGIVAGRVDGDGIHYIKVWIMYYAPEIANHISG